MEGGWKDGRGGRTGRDSVAAVSSGELARKTGCGALYSAVWIDGENYSGPTIEYPGARECFETRALYLKREEEGMRIPSIRIPRIPTKHPPIWRRDTSHTSRLPCILNHLNATASNTDPPAPPPSPDAARRLLAYPRTTITNIPSIAHRVRAFTTAFTWHLHSSHGNPFENGRVGGLLSLSGSAQVSAHLTHS